MSEYQYEPFADTEEYRRVNTEIVRRWIDVLREAGTRQINRLLDIATGVGTMVELFLENLPQGWRQPAVVCVDANPDALEQTRDRLADRVAELECVESRAQEMELAPNSVDVAVWGNGIHYLDEEAQKNALGRISRALKSGGWLFFNSAFYAESRPADTIPFYRAQIANAVRRLKALGVRREEKSAHAQAGDYPDQSRYRSLLEQAGFAVEEMSKYAARLYQTAWENISGFSQYAAGALHGYRVDVAAQVLREAVGPSLEQHGFRDENGRLYIPRNWLAVAARAVKPAQRP
ncbi:MAG: class I SAM-dependent methyltransferase [Spirochaetaceae bacterium]